jgi:4-diphosphocytidyl-2-C-methyl-D-erythritol kinase
MAAPARGAAPRSAAPAAERLRVRCPAKINLGLWILGRRPDGYHEVDTFLQAISLEDEITIERGASGLALETAGLPIRGPGPNLIERAWALLEETGALPAGAGVRARLVKRIPPGSGLGGGSSDGAGFLAGVDRLLGLNLGPDDLSALAGRLGSDVPFFLRGGLARATGRGEQVRHLCPITPFWIVLATPATAISTTWAYGQIRNGLTPNGEGARVLASAITRRDLHGVANAMSNAFEGVILPYLPGIAELKRALVSSGAIGALLSGSGSTVFGVSQSLSEAQAVLNAVGNRGAEFRIARSIEHGAVVSRAG